MRPIRRGLTWLSRLDRAVYDRVASRPLDGVGPALTRLSRAADHGRLWVTSAVGIALVGGQRGRIAARRGLLALAIASATANLGAKQATRRRRPEPQLVPLLRRLDPMPSSTSFPSGHTASAAAFAIAAGSTGGAWRWPLATLAVGVGASRVTNGAHYPGDVLAGGALGAAAATVAMRLGPPDPPEPPHGAVAPAVLGGRPCDPDGTGLHIVVNPGAGADRTERVVDQLHRALPGAQLVVHDPEGDLEDELDRAAAAGRALGIMGGDGSVNAAISAARRHDRPLAILPGGTLNHLASDLGIDTLPAAIDAVREGRVVAIDLLTIGERPVANAAAIGWYPTLVDRREGLETMLGKWPAAVLAALATALRSRPVELTIDGQLRRVWLLVIGNGCFHDHQLAPIGRDRFDLGCLDVRLVTAERPWSRLRLLLAWLVGHPRASRVVERHLVNSLVVASSSDVGAGPRRIARDGEVEDAPADLRVELLPGGLHVLQPTRVVRASPGDA